MDMFGRDLAPISNAALKEIDSQAARTLRGNLAARKFADVKGPYGWTYAGVPAGTLDALQKEGEVGFGIRDIAPLVETRVEFALSAIGMHNIDRGCANPDLIAVEKAAIAAAAFEDKVIFEGFAKAGIKGLKNSGENPALELTANDPGAFLKEVIDATDRSKTEYSISGPFALIGGKDLRGALAALVGNRTILELLKKSADIDEFIYAPNAPEGYLVSKRGGDFEITLGGDFVIGYHCRRDDALNFYLAESFSFRVLESRAYTPVKLK
ncbi:MAG: bacteriocin family protein [Synergistaceae bacterium]|jgi:uncharacterized linocin/CFP29 family protein|nr:bacteriocin family protein [Synergistaceae bacterium]